jgi:hypothetical protein
MQYRNHPFTSFIKVAACAVFTAAVVAMAADPAGTWTWSTPGRNGGPDRKSTLKLKCEGDKLTGTLSNPGRGGGPAVDTEITDGKVKGDEVSFTVTREFNGNKMSSKYAGKLSGDTIKGKISFENRNGEAQTRDWEAKRDTEKK